MYVDQAPRFEPKYQEYKKYKLKKSLYGLKQAPRAYYGESDSYLLNNELIKRNNEPTLLFQIKLR